MGHRICAVASLFIIERSDVLGVPVYLLWTRACSTLVVLSEGGVPAEF